MDFGVCGEHAVLRTRRRGKPASEPTKPSSLGTCCAAGYAGRSRRRNLHNLLQLQPRTLGTSVQRVTWGWHVFCFIVKKLKKKTAISDMYKSTTNGVASPHVLVGATQHCHALGQCHFFHMLPV